MPVAQLPIVQLVKQGAINFLHEIVKSRNEIDVKK